jgi:predicted RNase H-like HicB family nuclease
MKEIEFLVEEHPGGGFSARATDCGIFTEADSLEELRRNVREAASCHCEECSQPEAVVLRFVGDGRVERIEL